MKNKLLELSGIDTLESYNFKWRIEKKLEGYLDFTNKELIGASISKEVINYKILDGFEDSNFDNLEIYNNIIVLNNQFNIALEYSQGSDFGRLNLLNHRFYKTFTTSLKNYNFNNLEIDLLIIDFNLYPLEEKLYYYADILIGINEL
ncbi:MAG: hypothetical protein ACRC3Y_13335 [Romboutsia sp.]|uniref:hypothetical protein n=1 Tax=Romboutsia sp. TaxID=1965302 RepID=UPI003F2E37A0